MNKKSLHESKSYRALSWYMRTLFAFGILTALTSCSGISKGIMEAILEHEKDEVDSICEVKGRAFEGINAFLEKQAKTENKTNLKILMVHGIGEHASGYSARIQKNLMQSLSLTVSNEKYKEIELRNRSVIDQDLGNLRVTKYYNEELTKEAYFYELTWSKITEGNKKFLDFDKTGDPALYRSSLNQDMKEFVNDHIADPLLYVGNKRDAIQSSMIQALCWLYKENWEGLEENSAAKCDPAELKKRNIRNTDVAIITHSMGSQISVDALQLLADRIRDSEQKDEKIVSLSQELKNAKFSIYMLANQLPLLQLGVNPPQVSDKISAYCEVTGPKYADRIIDNMSIYAFSDPNDIFSYAVEPRFVDRRIDSRLCPTVTNININIAEEFNLLALGEVTNPMEAHTNYDADKRVIDLIAYGIGTGHETKLISEKCTWHRTIAQNSGNMVDTWE